MSRDQCRKCGTTGTLIGISDGSSVYAWECASCCGYDANPTMRGKHRLNNPPFPAAYAALPAEPPMTDPTSTSPAGVDTGREAVERLIANLRRALPWAPDVADTMEALLAERDAANARVGAARREGWCAGRVAACYHMDERFERLGLCLDTDRTRALQPPTTMPAVPSMEGQ